MTEKPTPQNPADAAVSDIDMVAKVVADLHIAHRNLSIYPPTHEQVKQSVQQAYTGLAKVLKQHETLTLAVMKDGIAWGESALPANNQIYKDFAQILKKYQIATLTFEPEMDETELIRFLLLIGADRQDVAEQGGIEAAAEACNLSNISLAAVDFSKLELTEESEIQRSGDQQQASVWQQFVMHMVDAQGQPDSPEMPEGRSLPKPDELATLLNLRQLDAKEALRQYNDVLSEIARLQDDQPQSLKGLQNFQEMIKELNPELRDQFLSTTLTGCSAAQTEGGTERLIEGLGADLIVQMIRQANAEGKEISPSLISFIKKMGHLDLGQEVLDGEDTAEKSPLGSEQVASLLAHEEYDHFVDEDYGILLDSLAEDDQETDSASESLSLTEELAQCLIDTNINCHVSRAMVELMAQSFDPADYRSWGRQLSYLLDDLLDTEAYECLTETLQFVRDEQEHNDQEKAKIADIILDQFNSPEFVTKAVARIMKAVGNAAEQGMDFLLQLGEPVVVEIMDLLSTGESEFDRKKLLASLDRFGPLAAREAVERLNDSRLKFLRMMIQIVRRLGDRQSAEQLRTLLNHADKDIRMEALSTLLRFKNKWGLIHLRELINEPWSDGTAAAIALAGTNKVKDVVPILIAFAQRRGDAQRQEAALRALGAIGDAQAIPVLDKLVRRRWTMSKKHRLHLQQIIFDSLDGYASQDILDLLHFGMKQQDHFVRSSCEKRLRRIRLADRT